MRDDWPLHRAGAVVFDCDSTLSAIEGIEYLARQHRSEIEQLTDAAMRGEVPLEDVYARRLELVRPDRDQVEALGRAYVDALVEDAVAVIAALRAEGIAVRVVSGGLLPPVAFLASHIGIEDGAVAAVDIAFDASGAYAGFDTESPLARSGGKAEVIRGWRKQMRGPIVLVGDGATDLEAADAVDLFIAFAGVVDRPAVTSAADAVVRSHSLAPVLPIVLSGMAPASPEHSAIFEKGLRLLDAATQIRLLEKPRNEE